MSETRSRIAPGITMPSFAPSVPSFPSGGGGGASLRVPSDYGPSTPANPLAAAQGAVDIARGIQQYRSGQISLRQAQQADVNRWLVPLLQNPNATEADVAKYLGIARANGANVGSALDEYHASGMTPTQWVQSRVTSAGGLTPAERVQYVTPGVGPQVAGAGPGGMPGTYTTTTGAPISAAPGVTQPQAFVPSGLSAAQAAQELHYRDPSSGIDVQTTVGNYATKFGMGWLAFPQGGWMGNIGFAPNAPGNPRLVGAGGGGAAAPSTAPSAPAAATGGGTTPAGAQSQPAFGPAQPGGPQPRLQPSGAQQAQPPGQTTELRSPGPAVDVEASQTAWNTDLRNDSNYAQRTFPLIQANDILQRDPDLTGEGAPQLNRMKAALAFWVPKYAPDIERTTKFQELGKYLSMAVMNNRFAARSDQALGETISGTPNTKLLGLSNQELVKAMIGLERMQHMAVSEWNTRSQNNPQAAYGQYNKFIQSWQTGVDPRAFVADMLGDKERESLLKSLDRSPQARRTFNNTLDLIDQHPDILGQPAMP